MFGPLDFWLWTSGVAVVVVGARVQDASEPLVQVLDDSAVLVTVTDAPEA